MNVRPVTNNNFQSLPSFKGTVDDSLKKGVKNALKSCCADEYAIANSKNRPVDTVLLKTQAEVAQKSIKKLDEFMKKCHKDTKIIYNPNSKYLDFTIKNKSITDDYIYFDFNPHMDNLWLGMKLNVYTPRLKSTMSAIDEFSEFVNTFTNSVKPQDIDSVLLTAGKKDLVSLLTKKPSFIKNIKAKFKAKKLEKIAKEAGLDDIARDYKYTVDKCQFDNKNSAIEAQMQAKLRADNKRVVKEILDKSNIID